MNIRAEIFKAALKAFREVCDRTHEDIEGDSDNGGDITDFDRSLDALVEARNAHNEEFNLDAQKAVLSWEDRPNEEGEEE